MQRLKLTCLSSFQTPTLNPSASDHKGTFHRSYSDIPAAPHLEKQLLNLISQAHLWLPFGL